MKNIVSESDINRLLDENKKMSGTSNFNKFHMMKECKVKVDGKWGSWKFLGWGVPTPCEFKVKKVGRKIYLVKEYSIVDSDQLMIRYTITDECNEILNVY